MSIIRHGARSRRAGGALLLASLACLLALPDGAALAAVEKLRFVRPRPTRLVTGGTVAAQLVASCGVDVNSLALRLDGQPLDASGFQPFSACVRGRRLSAIAALTIPSPESGAISGPTRLTAGETGSFSTEVSGAGRIRVTWNFDGGAAPAAGSPVSARFAAAGAFTVRARALSRQVLTASALAGVQTVSTRRLLRSADASPASLTIQVAMPAEVDFANFESPHAHPLALATDRQHLYAANTPEGRLAIFDVAAADGRVRFAADVAVGVEPVSLAVRPDSDEVWVVNWLSDSISIVDVATRRVVETLPVGDEPSDVVFAAGRAFVTVGGKDDQVRVFDAATRQPVVTLPIFSDTPRALAASPDGSIVYAIALESGNQSTNLPVQMVGIGGGAPPSMPPRAPELGPAPVTSLIVQVDAATGLWQDDTGQDWSGYVDFTLPDRDLFVIDAAAPLPSIVDAVSRLGTVLFDVAVQPGTGAVWVANTEALNRTRFEPNLRGRFSDTRVAIVDPSSRAVDAVDLNPHIDRSVAPGPAAEIAASLAIPVDGEFSSDGATFYLAALGSAKVGVLDANGAVTGLIDVGGGPSGVALNEPAARLYVLNRFDHTISTVATDSRMQLAVTGIAGPAGFDPSPDVIKSGRKFLYDAQISSGHGDLACASCHVFGNLDGLAWDLGDPQGGLVRYADAPWVHFDPLGPAEPGFDPMKGPMTTQTLRGLAGLDPLHWRGDRRNFQHFNGAFVSLMGRGGICSSSAEPCGGDADCPLLESCLGLSTGDMDAFADFIHTVRLGPNPYRGLDDSLPDSIAAPTLGGGGATAPGHPSDGMNGFVNLKFDPPNACNVCHRVPTGTTANLSQDFKIPHLRNAYDKLGFDVIRPGIGSGDGTNRGLPEMRKGFGFTHDGSVSLLEFLSSLSSSLFLMTAQQRLDVFAFLVAFGTDTAPAVGHQVTITAETAAEPSAGAVIATLIAQAEAGKCDLIVKGVSSDRARGWVYRPERDAFQPDSLTEPERSEAALRAALSSGDVLTYTGVPPGSGTRLGIDRDRDTWPDRSETALGYDPANPNSNPWQSH